MFEEFLVPKPIISSPTPAPTNQGMQPWRSKPAAAKINTSAPVASIQQENMLTEVQEIAARVLGSPVATTASFSDAGLDSLGTHPLQFHVVWILSFPSIEAECLLKELN